MSDVNRFGSLSEEEMNMLDNFGADEEDGLNMSGYGMPFESEDNNVIPNNDNQNNDNQNEDDQNENDQNENNQAEKNPAQKEVKFPEAQKQPEEVPPVNANKDVKEEAKEEAKEQAEQKVEDKVEEKAEGKQEAVNNKEAEKEPEKEIKFEDKSWQKSDEDLARAEFQDELDKLVARRKKDAEKQAAAQKKEEERKKKREQEAAEKKKKEEAKGKPKFFDRGITPALGFAVGAAVGFVLKIAILAIPMLTLALGSGIAKVASFAARSARYRREEELRKMLGQKKQDEKEKEDAKKSEKELEKDREKQKEKVKAPEVKEKEAKQSLQSREMEAKKAQVSGKRAEFNKWVNETRNQEMQQLNNFKVDDKIKFEKQKKEFVKHLYRATVLTQMSLFDKSGKDVLSQKDYKGAYNKMVKNQKMQWQFKEMVDEIKNPEDIEKFKKLANKDNGLGIYNELAKHHKGVAKFTDELKHPQRVSQKQNLNKNMGGPHV